MRWIVGGNAVERDAAPTSQMGRFETAWLASDENLAALTDIAGYRSEFLKLFGFGLPGINYEAETEPHVPMP